MTREEAAETTLHWLRQLGTPQEIIEASTWSPEKVVAALRNDFGVEIQDNDFVMVDMDAPYIIGEK